MPRRLLALLLMLSGCHSIDQGPPVDLAVPAIPDPVPATRPLPAAPVQKSEPAQDAWGWRAWVPPHIQQNGDRIEGHYMTITPFESRGDVLPAPTVIPRAPHEEVKRPHTPQRQGVKTPQTPPLSGQGSLPQLAIPPLGIPTSPLTPFGLSGMQGGFPSALDGAASPGGAPYVP